MLPLPAPGPPLLHAVQPNTAVPVSKMDRNMVCTGPRRAAMKEGAMRPGTDAALRIATK